MSIQLPQTCELAPCKIVSGLLFQWHHGRRAYRICLKNSHHSTLDAYFEANILAIRGWSRDQPWISFHDISAPDVIITPFMRGQLEAFFNLVVEQGLSGHIVFLVANSFQGSIQHGFISATANETSRLRRYVYKRHYRAEEKFYQLLQTSQSANV